MLPPKCVAINANFVYSKYAFDLYAFLFKTQMITLKMLTVFGSVYPAAHSIGILINYLYPSSPP